MKINWVRVFSDVRQTQNLVLRDSVYTLGCAWFAEFCTNSCAPWLILLQHYNGSVHTYLVQNSQNSQNQTHLCSVWPTFNLKNNFTIKVCSHQTIVTPISTPETNVYFNPVIGVGNVNKIWCQSRAAWRQSSVIKLQRTSCKIIV